MYAKIVVFVSSEESLVDTWDVRAKPIISKIEFQRADIESNFKS